MTRNILIAMLLIAGAGCYRDPSDMSQVRQSVDSKDRRPQTMVPRGSLAEGDPSFPGATIQSRDVVIGKFCLTAPSDWMRRQPASELLLAEFSLFMPDGDKEGGRLTVSTAGGTVEDNVNRWKGQFGGTPDKESQESLTVSGVTITLVDYTGTFTDQRGPALSPPQDGYRMLGAIIPVDEKLFFVKGYGPEKVMTAHAEKIHGFLQSLKPKPAAEEKTESGETPAESEKPAEVKESAAGEKPAAGETTEAGSDPAGSAP